MSKLNIVMKYQITYGLTMMSRLFRISTIMLFYFFLLMYCGAMPAEGMWILLSRIGTAYWFIYFLVLAPVVGWLEKPHLVPPAIHLRDKK